MLFPGKGMEMLRSRTARLIFICNLSGLLVMLLGVVLFGELRSFSEMARSQASSLKIEAELLASVAGDIGVPGLPHHRIDGERIREVLLGFLLPDHMRVRIFGLDGELISDSWMLDGQIVLSELFARVDAGRKAFVAMLRRNLIPWDVEGVVQVEDHARELERAFEGFAAGSERVGEGGRYLISVTVPVRQISKVVGVLTVESADVYEVIRMHRGGVFPVGVVALLVALSTSAYLTFRVARPLRTLASAADRVRAGRSRQLGLGDYGRSGSEIRHLAQSLEAMTGSLTSRAEANARFAADVAHELKNPLTSIRSAVETLGAVDESGVKERMRSLILQDVYRMDRLITDISNAGRVEAELASKDRQVFDFGPVLGEIVEGYRQTEKGHYLEMEGMELSGLLVMGSADALAQVVRNLVDNAFSFSPTGGRVRLYAGITADRREVVFQVMDEGMGIPEGSREKIFQRFYSDREEFGKRGHSGLGLSIADHIVRVHGGCIRAENMRRGGEVAGAKLSVYLPYRGGGLVSCFD